MASRRCVVNVILTQNECVLLMKRIGTRSWVGSYTSPGGSVKENETYLQAAIRETEEEIGVIIKPEHLNFSGMFDKPCGKNAPVRVDYVYFQATEWHGDIQNCEPEKHDFPEWFNVHCLPETISPLDKMVIARNFKPEFVVI